VDLSVVIASHQDPLGLYLTTFAVIEQLSKTNLTWEIVLACDGGTPYKWEKQPNVRCLRIRTGSPQGTRDAGIRAAQAERILCIESHVIVSDIASFLEAHKALGGAMTFPARIGEGPEMFNVFGTETDWDGNLWFKRTLYFPQNGKEPYRVPQFGHSCFMINKSNYVNVGGYTDLLTGWGGEESLLCLKFWMLGYELWQTPNVWHAHYLDNRGAGTAMASENFTRNFAIGKYVLTGKVSSGLQVTTPIRLERDFIMAGPFGGDIEKLKIYFKERGIIN
jgi:hypothetical protein